MKSTFKLEWLLQLTFVTTAVSGIGLHIAGHGAGHEVWHNWAAAHILSSLFWLISVAAHIRRRWNWYKAVVSQGIGRKSRITMVLSAVFLIVAVTGIVLIACVDGADSTIGLWHYRIGFLLIAFSLIHIAKRMHK